MAEETKKLFLQIRLFALYFLLEVVGIILGDFTGQPRPLWTPMGVGMVILFFHGFRLWPCIFLGMLGAGLLLKFSLYSVFILALIHTGTILLIAALIKKADCSYLRSVRDVVILIMVAILGSFLEASMVTVVWLNLGVETWLNSWFSEFMGIIIIAPLLLTGDRQSLKEAIFKHHFWETLLLAIVTGLTTYLVAKYARGMFVLYFCLIWAALRFGILGLNLIVFLAMTIFAVQLGFREKFDDHLLKIELSMGLLTTSAMILAAAAASYRKIKNDLKKLNENLEQLVAERTKELLNEIAARKVIEKGLSESEAKYRGLYEAFIKSEQNFRSIIENSQEGMALIDGDGRIIEWNPGLEEIVGLSKMDVLGLHYWEAFLRLAPNNRSPLAAPYRLKELLPVLLRENQDRLPEIRIKRLDGSERVVHLLTFVIKSNESTMVGGIFRDVTEQILTKQSMIRYAERLKILYEIDHDILRAGSLKGLSEIMLVRLQRLSKCRKASILILEQSEVEPVLLSMDFKGETIWGPGVRLSLENYQIPKEFASGKEYLIDDLSKSSELSQVYRDMEKEGIRSYLSLPLLAQGELIGSINLSSESPGYFSQEIVKVIRQVTNHFAAAIYQARLYKQLGENREQLRQLAQRLVLVQEEERRHLSRELHDDTGQELTALKIMLSLIFQDLPQEYPQLRSGLEEAINLTNMVMEKIRSLAQGLRPPVLDAVGLVPALEELCKDFSRRTGLILTYKADQMPVFPESLNICLYRVLQEGLTNIAKHAKAREIKVQLIRDGETIYLSVEDDGVGFSQNGEEGLNRKGLGLIGMQERLNALGGGFEIQTETGKGTRIIASIPWEGGSNGKSVDCR